MPIAPQASKCYKYQMNPVHDIHVIYLSYCCSLALYIILMAIMAEGEGSSQQYIVCFKGNNSKRWDGKEVWLDTKVLDELYDSSELFDGVNVIAP